MSMSAYIFVFILYMYAFVQAHIELQESLAATQRETLEGLQDSTTKMMSQQAEAARFTVDAARHIKEVSNHFLFSSWKTPCVFLYFTT